MAVHVARAQQAVLHEALALPIPESAPLLHRLYRDARRTWLGLPYLDSGLHRLVLDLAFVHVEISPEDDAQLRLAYGIRAVAA